jgi:transcriptional regulator with XRE-family HTH domain
MLSQNIKREREKKRISQRELARRIEKSGQYISYLENTADSNPSFDILKNIAAALQVDISVLLADDEMDFKISTQDEEEIVLVEFAKSLDLKKFQVSYSQDDIVQLIKAIKPILLNNGTRASNALAVNSWTDFLCEDITKDLIVSIIRTLELTTLNQFALLQKSGSFKNIY